MASSTLQLKIATPERLVYEATVDQVSIPTKNGEITVLPNHVPLITNLAAGDVVALEEGELVPMTVVGGFVEINDRNEIIVLADFAEHIDEVSEEEITAAKKRAEEMMVQREKLSKEDFEHFEAELERSLTRARIRGKWQSRKYKKLHI